MGGNFVRVGLMNQGPSNRMTAHVLLVMMRNEAVSERGADITRHTGAGENGNFDGEGHLELLFGWTRFRAFFTAFA